MPNEKPLLTLYKGLKANNYDVPDDYDSFERTLTTGGDGGAEYAAQSRHDLYNALKSQNYDVPDSYEHFYSTLFEPVSKTASRAKGGAAVQQPTQHNNGGGQQAQRAAAPKPQQQGMSAAERAAFINNAQGLVDKSAAGIRRTKNQMDYAKGNAGLRVKPVHLGQNSKVVKRNADGTLAEQRPVLDMAPQEQPGQTYVTESGNEFDNRAEADIEQNSVDQFKSEQNQVRLWNNEIGKSMSLDDAYAERDRLNKLLEQRGKELDAENEGKWWRDLPRGGGAGVSTVNALDNNGRTNDTEYLQLLAAAKKNDERIRDLEAAKAEKTGTFLGGLWRGFRDYAFDLSNWDNGYRDLLTTSAMLRAKTGAAQTPREKEAERSMLMDTSKAGIAHQKAEEELGNGYRFMRISAQSLPFALQFMAGNATGMIGGLTRAGEGLGVKMARQIAIKQGANNMMRNIGRSVLKNTGVALGDLAAATALTGTIQAGQTASDIGNRYIGDATYDPQTDDYKLEGGKSLGRSIYEGVANSTIENYTEQLGEHLHLGKWANSALNKIGLGKVSDWFTKVGKTDFMKGVNHYLEMGGFNGYPQEVAEEEIGIPLHAIFDGGNKMSDLIDGKQQLDIVGGMLFSMAGMGAASMTMQGGHKAAMAIQYHQDQHKLDNADKVASFRLTADKWAPIKEEIDGTTNQDFGETMKKVLSRQDLDDIEKQAVWDYAQRLITMRGHNMGQEAATRNGMTDKETNAANESYTQGYNTTDATAMNDARNRLALAQQKLDEYFEGIGNRVDKEHGWSNDNHNRVDPNIILNDEGYEGSDGQHHSMYSDDVIQMAQDVVNAQQEYEGMLQRVRDDIDDEVQQTGAIYDSRTNNQGVIQGATLKAQNADGTDRKVYITSGNVVMGDDGQTVDKQKSDMSIVVVDEDGKVEMISPDQIFSLDAPIDGAQAKQQAIDAIQQNKAQEAADKINGKVDYTAGNTYTLTDSTGQQIEATLVADEQTGAVENPDGSVNVSMNGKIVPMAKDTFQQMVDNTNMQRASQNDEGGQEQPTEQEGDQGILDQGGTVEPEGGNVVDLTQEGGDEEGGGTVVPDEEEGTGAVPTYPGSVVAPDTSEPHDWQVDDTFTIDNGGMPVRGQVTGVGEDGVEIYTEAPVNGKKMQVVSPEELQSMTSEINGQPLQSTEDAATLSQPTQPVDETQQTGETEGEVNLPQNGENANIQPESEEKTPQRAIDRIPSQQVDDGKGNVRTVHNWEQAEPGNTYDALTEIYHGNADRVKKGIDNRVGKIDKAIKGVQKKMDAIDNSDDFDEVAAQAEQYDQLQQQKDALEQQKKYWQGVSMVPRNRQMEADRRTAEEKAAAKAAREKAEAEAAEKARQEREQVNGVPDVINDVPADARKRGFRNVNGMVVNRQGNTDGVTGRESNVKFSSTDTAKGHIKVIDADQLQPSHVSGQRNPSFFIDEAQPKDRTDTVSSMAAAKIASNLNPEEITGDGSAYQFSAPTVNSRGEVIQGNNRSDALKLMYSSTAFKPAQDAYKQYIADHAEEFGFSPEDIQKIQQMQHPVMVNELDVPDDEAIRLGQMKASDNESGGIERIDPVTTSQKLGGRVSNFASVLLSSPDEDASLSDVLMQNGAKAVKWLQSQGAISDTAAQSAFDKKGNLTPEARMDLQNILKQSLFQGGVSDLSAMFDKMPAKAQKAILSTFMRDYDSAESERILPEIQKAIEAWYGCAMANDAFAKASNYKSAKAAMHDWTLQTNMLDDNMPSDKFSNFAMELASRLQGCSMRETQQNLNDFFDLVQGKSQGDFFSGTTMGEQTDSPEAIRRIFNIEYKPISNNNGKTRSNAVADNNSQSGKGRQGSPADSQGRERAEGGEQPNADTGGAESHDEEGIDYKSLAKAAEDMWKNIPDNLKKNGLGMSTSDSLVKNKLKQIEAILKKEELSTADYARLNGLLDDLYSALNTLDAASHNGKQSDWAETQVKSMADKVLGKYGEETVQNGHDALVKDIEEQSGRDNVVSHGTTNRQDVYIDGNIDWLKSAANRKGAAASGSEHNQANSNSSDSQNSNNSLGATSTNLVMDAERQAVNTEPTEKQKEAGNYKKGHIKVDGYDITIENPKGSTRSGKDANGKEWSVKMNYDYGYILGTKGTDGDHIDVYLSDNTTSGNVYVVDQIDQQTGKFDEHKVMYGFPSKEAAIDAYKSQYEKGWKFGKVTEVSREDFKKWVESSTKKTKPFSEYKSVKEAATQAVEAPTLKEPTVYKNNLAGGEAYVNIEGNPKSGYVARYYDNEGDARINHLFAIGAEPMTAEQLAGHLQKGDFTAVAEPRHTEQKPKPKRNQPKKAEKPQQKEEKPSNQGQFGLVSDERMEELKKRLRAKLNNLNMGVDPEVLAIGLELTAGYIDRGIKKFADYSKAMISDLGDVVRPYLKAFYNGVRDMPEITSNGLDKDMDDYDTVSKFNVATIGKEGEEAKPSILDTAEQVSNEQTVKQNAKKVGGNKAAQEYWDSHDPTTHIRYVNGKWNGVPEGVKVSQFIDGNGVEQRASSLDANDRIEFVHNSRNNSDTVRVQVYDEHAETPAKIRKALEGEGYDVETNGYSSGYVDLPTYKEADDFAKHVDEIQKRVDEERRQDKVPTDNQGNPIDENGKLVKEKVASVNDITDEDFTNPTRTVELPKLPSNVDAAIGADGKPVIIKKNIFEKNAKAHQFQPDESRRILKEALYNTDLVGQTQPEKRPNHWVAIKIDEESPITVLEVNDNKDNVEVVGWYRLDDRNLGRIQRQAEREGGELLILTPKGAAASLSTLPHSSSSTGKVSEKTDTKQEKGKKKVVTSQSKEQPSRVGRERNKEQVDPSGKVAMFEKTDAAFGKAVEKSGDFDDELKSKEENDIYQVNKKAKADLLATLRQMSPERLENIADGIEHADWYDKASVNTQELVRDVILENDRRQQLEVDYEARLEKSKDIVPKEPQKKVSPADFLTKDKNEQRTFTNGVGHDGGNIIGTDGHVLYVQKADYPKELEGKITDKDGKVIEGKVPMWRKAIPKVEDTKPLDIDIDGLHRFTAGVNRNNRNGSYVAFKDGKGEINLFRSKDLDVFLRAAKQSGAEVRTYPIYGLHNDPHTALMFSNDKGTGLIMPASPEYINESYVYEDNSHNLLYRESGDDTEKLNDRFNEDIGRYNKGTLPQGFRFDLGYPSAELRSAGFDNLSISMRASLLSRKAGDERHPFEASDLKDLVKAIQKPIAIFRYSKGNMRNLIVDTQRNGKRFLVGVTLNYKANGIEINSVSGLFPKENHEWIKWIQDGKAIRIDQKEKVLNLIDSLRTNPAESKRIGLDLDSAAKIVKDFENPTIEEEKLSRNEPTTPAEAEESGVLYREVDDEEAARLDNEPTIKVYRAMQQHDGKLYPPMSGRIKTQVKTKKGTMRNKWVWRSPIEIGKWEASEEHPEMANEDGTFTLDKGNGSTIDAAYNPYIHTSRTPINDQFSSAWNRPELVTVEVEVPASELTSGYHAEKAKDATGEVEWKSGPVGRERAAQGNPRMVILSRWDKPVRIVPVDEVADEYAVRLAGTGITVPFNTVPPALREALVARGVEISEPEKGNAGQASRPSYEEWLKGNNRQREGRGAYSDEDLSLINDPVAKWLGKGNRTKAQQKAFANRERKSMEAAVKRLAKRLHLDNVNIVMDASTLEGRKGRAKGFYDRNTQQITIVIPNHRDVEDVMQTLLHEGVAHYGLRKLFGSHFDTFLDNVYAAADSDVRRRITDLAIRKYKGDFHVATEEYLASLAEDTDFERMPETFWQKIKRMFLAMLRDIGFEDFANTHAFTLSDNELRYILWRSYENLKEPGRYRSILGEAEDVAMQAELHVGNYGLDSSDSHDSPDSINTEAAESREDAIKRLTPRFVSTFKKWLKARRDWEKAVDTNADNALELADELNKWNDMMGAALDTAYGLGLDERQFRQLLSDNGIKPEDFKEYDDMFAAVYGNMGSDNNGVAEPSPKLSSVKNEFGKPFVLSSKGSIDMGVVDKASGLKEAPIRLSEGEDTVDEDGKHHGYGLLHIAAEHEEEIRKAGYNSVEEFVEDVASNYNTIREGNVVANNQTYLLELTDKHNNTLYVELSRDGKYWNINSAGVFRKGYSKNKKEVYSRPAVGSSSGTRTAGVNHGVNNSATVTSGNSPLTSTAKLDNKSESGVNSSENVSEPKAWGKRDLLSKAEQISNGIEPDLLFRDTIEDNDNTARLTYDKRADQARKQFREAWQDSMINVRNLQDAVLKQRGEKLEPYEDAYNEENRSHGIGQDKSEYFTSNLYKPVIEAVNQVAKAAKVSIGDVTEYMMAKHGLERNKVFAKRDAEAAWAKYQEKQKERFDKYQKEHPKGKKTIADFMEKSYNDFYKDYREKDYSGLTALTGTDNVHNAEAEAKRIVNDLEGRTVTKNLWSKVNAATKWTLQQAHESGIISRDNYQNVKDMFDYYIPLRGWNEDTAGDIYDYVGSENNNAFSPTLAKAKGRKSQADNPIAYIGSMGISAIVQGERNRVKQAFMRFAENHPSNLVTVSEMWYRNFGTETDPDWREDVPNIPENATADQVAAIVEQHEKDMKALEAQGLATKKRGKLHLGVPIKPKESTEHHVEVMLNGKKYVLYINGNPRAAQALNGTRSKRAQKHSTTAKLDDIAKNFENMHNWIGRMLAKLTRMFAHGQRWMGARFTSKNPAFILRNAMRDVDMALASTAIKESPMYALRFRLNLARLAGPVRMFGLKRWYEKYRAAGGNGAGLTGLKKYYYEFNAGGARTGFTSLKDIEEYKKDIEKMVKQSQQSVVNPLRWLRALGDGFEFANSAVEDMTRFATFMAARQSGRNVRESVTDAKNITLNFNRKGSGEMGNASIREMQIFVNPAIQALQNIASMAADHPVKFSAYTAMRVLIGMGTPFATALLWSAFGGGDGDDDDWNAEDEYWKLPTWTRRSNFVCWIPGTKKFMMIPLAQEFRVANGFGETIASVMTGHSDENPAVELLGQASGLLPIDFTGNGNNPLITLSPTIIQPLMQVGFNTDFTGRPIYKDSEWNKYEPSSQKAYIGTPSELVGISAKINNLTGGNEHKQGWWERTLAGKYANNPAIVDHVLKGYYGGLYSFLAQLGGLAFHAYNGETPDVQEVPMANSLITAPREKLQNGKMKMPDWYYDLQDENKRYMGELNGYRKDMLAKKPEARKHFMDMTKTDEFVMQKQVEMLMSGVNQIRAAMPMVENPQDAAEEKTKKELEDNLQEILSKLDTIRKTGKPLANN